MYESKYYAFEKEILFLKFHFRPPLLHVYHLLAFILHTNVHCTLGEKGSKLAQTYFCGEKYSYTCSTFKVLKSTFCATISVDIQEHNFLGTTYLNLGENKRIVSRFSILCRKKKIH